MRRTEPIADATQPHVDSLRAAGNVHMTGNPQDEGERVSLQTQVYDTGGHDEGEGNL